MSKILPYQKPWLDPEDFEPLPPLIDPFKIS